MTKRGVFYTVQIERSAQTCGMYNQRFSTLCAIHSLTLPMHDSTCMRSTNSKDFPTLISIAYCKISDRFVLSCTDP